MQIWRRLTLGGVAIAGGVIVAAALILTLRSCATWSSSVSNIAANAGERKASAPTSTQPASLPTVSADTVAIVNNDPIARIEWQKAAALDRAMSQLAGQPSPTAEATLDRLINELLVLRLVEPDKLTVSDADAKQWLAGFQQNGHVDDATVDRTLLAANLTRTDLLAEIKRLLAVETYLKQISKTQDPAGWLAAKRSQAQVGIYADLTAPITSATSAASTASATQVVTPMPTLKPTPSSISLPVGSAAGQLAPDFTLSDMNGQPIKLKDLRGHPVVINFWATWCPPCRQELPALQSAYQRYRDKGIVLLGVDLKESAETVQSFVSQFGLTYPLLLDRDGVVSERYQVRGIPTSVILDTEGVVRARHVGPLTGDQFAEYVFAWLATPASTPTLPSTPAKAAPDFGLPRESGQLVRLSDYRDKSNVVLVFYRGQT